MNAARSPRNCLLAALVAIAVPELLVGDGFSRVRAQPPKVRTRPAEYQVTIEKNVMIPMRDGVRLAADIYRPGPRRQAGSGPVPDALDPHAL